MSGKIVKCIVKVLSFIYPRKTIGKIVEKRINRKNGVLLFYRDPARSEIIDLIKGIKRENEMLLDNNEAYQIHMAVERTAKIDGDIAEVGTYKGGSAKLICEAKGNKILHLFDTFEGLPDLSHTDNPTQFHKGKFIASFQAIKEYLKEYKSVHFYKGLFPSTADPIKNKKFSFVHLDVDLHDATLACLEFFYPRMNKGGIIISHDYIHSAGVRKAFDDFFRDRQEPIIEMSGSQCLIVKT